MTSLVWTPDLIVCAVLVAAFSLLVAAFGVAERQRFTDPRPASRHRRRLSKSEFVMEAREIMYTFGYFALGLGLLAAAGFGFLVAGLHRLDAWRMRRFWGGQSVHS